MNRIPRVLTAVAVATAGAAAVSLPTYGARAAAPSCSSSALGRTTSTNGSTFRRGTPIKVSTSLVNASGRTCAVNIHACVSATVTNSSGTVVWSAVPLNALCAQYIVRQDLAPGQAVTRSWTWDQRVCVYAGKCPGPQVAAGRYVAQGHWGGGIGDARPAPFTIRP